ncbi:putative transmembrane protein [Thalictrum thalictroides]|uniref:Putative transmembrane protein n=1 Tax=Thalictrum thalictroides TaxID=46969 RepID=A0A7J6WJL8_THATH|nr:putative transmembrane protein [Thalictrum thalictroides]
MGTDWGPVIIAVVLFILLSPGLLFQMPARTRFVEFGNMYTSGISILVHAIIFFCILTVLLIAIGVHIHVKA